MPAGAVGGIYLQRFPLPADLLASHPTLTARAKADNTWDAATATVYAYALAPPH